MEACIVLNKPADDEEALAMELGQMCELYRSLPRAGGVLEQDSYHVMLIRAYNFAIAKKRDQDQKKAISEAKRKRR